MIFTVYDAKLPVAKRHSTAVNLLHTAIFPAVTARSLSTEGRKFVEDSHLNSTIEGANIVISSQTSLGASISSFLHFQFLFRFGINHTSQKTSPVRCLRIALSTLNRALRYKSGTCSAIYPQSAPLPVCRNLQPERTHLFVRLHLQTFLLRWTTHASQKSSQVLKHLSLQ